MLGLSVFLPLPNSVSLSFYLSQPLSLRLSLSLSQPVSLSACLSPSPNVSLSLRLSLSQPLSVRLSLSLNLCLSIRLFLSLSQLASSAPWPFPSYSLLISHRLPSPRPPLLNSPSPNSHLTANCLSRVSCLLAIQLPYRTALAREGV